MSSRVLVSVAGISFCVAGYLLFFSVIASQDYRSASADEPERFIPLPALDRADYDARMLALAHISPATTTATSSASTTPAKPRLWPVAAVYPEAGAILPFQRVIAYYGNFYSQKMGVLGEYPEDEVISKLLATTASWAAADPSTPTIPAIHYIATVAQGSAGKEGKYILRMPDSEVDHALAMAKRVHGLLFLDIQVAQSTLEHELPMLDKYLAMPEVHLGIDPEFSMKTGGKPGTIIGTFDAADINYAAQYLARLVRENHLPPKILVVHRFTQNMVTNYKDIKPLPEVQIVMDMDGWGPVSLKKGTYARVIAPEPVQFTGIKLFYHADLKAPSTGMMTASDVLGLTPAPIYIQYQ